MKLRPSYTHSDSTHPQSASIVNEASLSTLSAQNGARTISSRVNRGIDPGCDSFPHTFLVAREIVNIKSDGAGTPRSTATADRCPQPNAKNHAGAIAATNLLGTRRV